MDEKARGIIIVGIPFPLIKDLKIILKKQYNDHKLSTSNHQKTIISGN